MPESALQPDHVLATVPLHTVRGRTANPRAVAAGTVTLSRPLLQPVPEAEQDLFDIWLAFEVTPPPRWSRHVEVFLRVCFEDRRVTVLEMEHTADDCPPALVEGLQSHAAGLAFENSADRPIRLGYAAHVLVSVPADAPELTGTLRVDLSVTRGLGRIAYASAREPTAFKLQLPAERTTVPAAGTSLAAPAAPESGVHLCVAADIERFSRFRTREAPGVQERFLEILAAARRHAGVQVSAADLQRSGDGQFAILPAGIDEGVVIPRLVEGLNEALVQANHGTDEHTRLRLRVAMHRGYVSRGPNGWIGNSAIAVHRLLDSAPLRQALTGRPEADLALAVSDTLYQDVIAQGFESEAFQPTKVELPAKNFTEVAWIHVSCRAERNR